MAIERWTITDREEWLKRRKPNINGSEIGALFGCNPFMTHFALYAEKAGHVDGIARETDAMRRGRVMEPSVALAVAEEHPDWVIKKALDYVWSPEWRLGCTPDFRVSIPGRGRVVLQAKTVAWPVFADKWQGGPPQWIMLQTLQEMMLDDAEMGIIAAMVTSSYDYELHLYDFQRHAGAEAKIVSAAAMFWSDVDAGRQPAPNYALDGDTIKAMHPRDSGEVIDLSGDNRMPVLLDRYEELSALGNHAEKELKAIKAELAAKMGDATEAIVPGWDKVTLKTQERAGHTVKPTTFRKFHIKRSALQQQEEAA